MNQCPQSDSEARRPWASFVLVAALLALSGATWAWEEHGGKPWLVPLMQRWSHPNGEMFALWHLLSAIGNGWILCMCLLSWLLVARAPERVLWCLVALAASGLLVAVLKVLVERVRPEGDQAASWPSGHSAAVFAVATLFPSERVRFLAGYPLAMLVGCSRVALNRHYPADVLAGAAFGLLCGVTMQRWHLASPPWLRAPALRLIAGAALFGICLFRLNVDFQMLPVLGVFGVPLFLGSVLAVLLGEARAQKP